MSMKNFNDTIGNGTRDLQACSAVPQPTAPPYIYIYNNNNNNNTFQCADFPKNKKKKRIE